jgi:hypothetical protein
MVPSPLVPRFHILICDPSILLPPCAKYVVCSFAYFAYIFIEHLAKAPFVKVKLGTPEADECPFKFKIGDKVCYRPEAGMGKVVSGSYYAVDLVPRYVKVFYEIELFSGSIRLADESDLESLA